MLSQQNNAGGITIFIVEEQLGHEMKKSNYS